MQTGSIRPRLYIPTTIHRSQIKLRILLTMVFYHGWTRILRPLSAPLTVKMIASRAESPERGSVSRSGLEA